MESLTRSWIGIDGPRAEQAPFVAGAIVAPPPWPLSSNGNVKVCAVPVPDREREEGKFARREYGPTIRTAPSRGGDLDA
jgi:hypothetical protein